MATRSPAINVMVKAAMKATRQLLHDFNEVEQLQVSKKGPADFVSNADTAAENTIVDELKYARRDYGFLLEEGNEIESKDELKRRWIIDPLDGTTNFLHGIPHFAISIALEEAGEIVSAVIYEPTRDELFWAEKGKGAYLNDRRLRVSARRNLEDSVFATGIPTLRGTDHAFYLKQLEAVMTRCSSVRRLGAAALDLAYVAAGRYDGYWERGLSPWDIAAGLLIVKEAGGYCTDYRNRDKALETGEIVAANDQVHGKLLKVLRDATKA